LALWNSWASPPNYGLICLGKINLYAPLKLPKLQLRVQKLPKKFEVHLFGRVRDVIKAKKLELEVEVEVETLEQLLHHLWKVLLKDARSILFDGEGDLKPFFLVIVDDREVRLPRDLKLELRDGASVKILPPIGAG